MNIGFFTDTYLPQINGVVTSIEIFRKELLKLGHRVYLYGPRFNSRNDPVYDHAHDIYRFYSVPYFRQKEHRIVVPFSPTFLNFRRFKLDIIHTHTYFPLGIYAAYLAKRHRIPLVHTYHTLWAEYAHYSFLPPETSRRALTWGSKFYCNRCDLVLAPSRVIREVLLHYGVRKPIQVLPTGIEAELTTTQTNFNPRQVYGIARDTVILSFVGRFGKEKNLYFLTVARGCTDLPVVFNFQ